jgi:hypothetical protein
MSNRKVKVPKRNEIGAFACVDCGRAYSTAAKFSDHAHVCLVSPVPWKVTATEPVRVN